MASAADSQVISQYGARRLQSRIEPMRGLLITALQISSCLLLASCETRPVHESIADNASFNSIIDNSPFFRHLLYTNASFEQPPAATKPSRLHVYLEGDGTPWRTRYVIASDPTPSNPLALKLMQLDQSPSLYVGRPCYFVKDRRCDNHWWTSARYSPTVVASMAQMITQYGADYDSWVFIGYSGGGTLALLIADHLHHEITVRQSLAVVTLAGNLDTDAWTSFHGYTPLHGSLNPAQLDPLPATIAQYHVAAEEDSVVLPDFIKRVAQKQRASFEAIPRSNHHCCWKQLWPALLERVKLLR